MNNNLKFTQHFAATTEGNRTITFLANSGKPMASGETVDLDSLQVRDPSTNQMVFVKDLKSTDVKNWMPLLKDHEQSIDAKIGQVRALWLTDEGLMMTAKLANTDDGDRIYQLAKDDMLDTFSITVAFDEQPVDGVIKNSQLLETSAVWLGNDETTKLMSVNEQKETTMAEQVKQNELTADEAKGLKDAIDALTQKVDELTAGGADEGTPSEQDVPQEPAQNSRQNVAENTRKVAADVKQNAHQVITNVTKNDGWLKTREALKAYRDVVVANHRRGAEAIKNAWTDKVRSFGITGDSILPTRIEQIFFKAWTDNDGILSTFRNSSAKKMSVYAASGDGEGIRAKGHKKGETKADQQVKLTRRDLMLKGIYKKLPIDLQDIVDDDSGDLLAFRTEELANRVMNEITVGAILGDGRTAPAANNPDYRVFDGSRGLYSMVADIAGNSDYQNIVANEITAAAGDDLYAMAWKALSAVKEQVAGRGKVLILPEGAVSDLLTARDANGSLVFPVGTTIDALFPNTRVFEMEEMVGNDYEVIAYANQGYALTGEGNNTTRTDFDLNTNTDVMLVERYVAGSLYGRKAAAGVKAAAGGAGA